MSETNWWGGQFGEGDPKTAEALIESQPVTDNTEKITEADKVRARVAVLQGESELYFIKIPSCDFSKLETHPAGGDVYEVVYNGTVFGYTKNKDIFHASSPEIKYN